MLQRGRLLRMAWRDCNRVRCSPGCSVRDRAQACCGTTDLGDLQGFKVPPMPTTHYSKACINWLNSPRDTANTVETMNRPRNYIGGQADDPFTTVQLTSMCILHLVGKAIVILARCVAAAWKRPSNAHTPRGNVLCGRGNHQLTLGVPLTCQIHIVHSFSNVRPTATMLIRWLRASGNILQIV
jgi:hypothetical protein